ncbi:hypothetical protein MCUN1_001180 [Malassezia cuniculi]|uniref:Mitochondrial adapter protein MCP1 transmembrane domain-containing protein n=1 Tax=Malassezia cuniculi TaxID=948313 RepID=A0AAF0EPS7_9BASI|nr:hypothetical protein MCUN1_001180 [Malassezia cuniculi]
MDWLGHLQSGSAATLGCVLVVHLAAPAVAALVPSHSIAHANSTMLFGRVFYQQRALEPILIWGALGTHIIASLLRKARIARMSPRPLRAFFRGDIQTIAGRMLVPLLGIHYVLNRVMPASARVPISELSPAELGMEYVSYGFSTWPTLTSVLYGLLIASAAVHVVGGAPKFMRRYGRRAPKNVWPIAAALGSVVAVGAARIALAPVGESSYMLDRVSRC